MSFKHDDLEARKVSDIDDLRPLLRERIQGLKDVGDDRIKLRHPTSGEDLKMNMPVKNLFNEMEAAWIVVVEQSGTFSVSQGNHFG